MFLYDGVWNRTDKNSFLPQTQTHLWLFQGWMEICECLFNILVFLWFLLGRQISNIPKRWCEKVPWDKGDNCSKSPEQGQGDEWEQGQKEVKHVCPFLTLIANLLCTWSVLYFFYTVDFWLSSTSSHESATASYHWVKPLPTLLEFLHDLEVALNPTSDWETTSQLSDFQLAFWEEVFVETLLEANMEN